MSAKAKNNDKQVNQTAEQSPTEPPHFGVVFLLVFKGKKYIHVPPIVPPKKKGLRDKIANPS